MLERLRDLRKRKGKGFTLVELIVVLVILAILIALLVPALTGYIDDARKKSVQVEARQTLTALQKEASEAYGSTTSFTASSNATSGSYPYSAANKEKVATLAEVNANNIESWSIDAKGRVIKLVYKENGHKATYTYTPATATTDAKKEWKNE